MWVLIAAAAASQPGCMRQRVVHDGWGWLRDTEWSDRPRTTTSAAQSNTGTAMRGGWAIQIALIDGRDRAKKAQQFASMVQQHSRMAEIWVEDVPGPDGKSGRTRVLAGRYRSGDDWGALEDLNHLRFVEVEGDYPFASAELIPLGEKLAPGDNPYDLKRYVGMYTLQIGFYDDAAGPEFRKLAEQAVLVLRDQGEQAYFYHGPHRALICLGLFSDTDFEEVSGTRVYGPRIKSLQERFPYNLANGYTQIERKQGQLLGEQPSFLVRVF
jgi:hypothetical protein